MDNVKRLIAWVMQTRPVRVFQSYGSVRGPILAGGLAYQALFAIFAALWVGFSIAGLVISGNKVLQQELIDTIAAAVPGLIDDGSGSGAIDPTVLLNPSVFSWTGIIALVGLLITALGFLAAVRDGIRVIFVLPAVPGNPVLLKLKDLAIGLAFAVAVVASTAMTFGGTTATSWILDSTGIGSESVVGAVAARIVTITVGFLIDVLTLGVAYRVLSGVRIPWRRLRGGVLIGAAALAVLKILFSAAVIGGVSNNPLLQSFAVILGLLIFFNFVCQVILIGAAWIAVGLADRGIEIDPAVTELRIADARALLAENGYASGRPVERRGRRFLRLERDEDVPHRAR